MKIGVDGLLRLSCLATCSLSVGGMITGISPHLSCAHKDCTFIGQFARFPGNAGQRQPRQLHQETIELHLKLLLLIQIVCGAGSLPALMVGMRTDQLCQKSSDCLQFILTPWACQGLWQFMMLTIWTSGMQCLQPAPLSACMVTA